jgi:hypothetical protein
MAVLIIQNREESLMSINTSWILSAFHGIQAFVLYAWYTATASQVKAFLKSEKQNKKN